MIHKNFDPDHQPTVSVVLLDWSVRERFQALEWLNRQEARRDSFEIIWIDLYNRVVPEALEMADMVVTLNQQGMYHKHKAYNEGLLLARGDLVTICDSDAVFHPRFIDSILEHFRDGSGGVQPLVLMHHEWRTADLYPDGMNSIEELSRHRWLDLWPNVGACMTVRKQDALRYGGFDEHRIFRGYLCGPYDLGWRLVNAGLPETWAEPDIALWHFAHPDPPASLSSGFSLRRWLEVRAPHLKYHALAAVEAFSSGRLLPRRENPMIFSKRMNIRRIGTEYEKDYANLCGPEGFSWTYWLGRYALLGLEGLARLIRPRAKLARSWLSGAVRRMPWMRRNG